MNTYQAIALGLQQELNNVKNVNLRPLDIAFVCARKAVGWKETRECVVCLVRHANIIFTIECASLDKVGTQPIKWHIMTGGGYSTYNVQDLFGTDTSGKTEFTFDVISVQRPDFFEDTIKRLVQVLKKIKNGSAFKLDTRLGNVKKINGVFVFCFDTDDLHSRVKEQYKTTNKGAINAAISCMVRLKKAEIEQREKE